MAGGAGDMSRSNSISIDGGYTLKCHLATTKERHCEYAIGNDGCLRSPVVCMMAYGIKDGEVVFDNFSYYQEQVIL
jgi:hypothetical protein